MTQWKILWVAFVLLFKVQKVKTINPCDHDEIFWKAADPANSTCLRCPSCPEGAEPSILCGSAVAYGTPLHCVPCKSGSYSDKFDTNPCSICTICTDGNGRNRQLKRCTSTSNTVCRKSCQAGYFKDFVFNCAPCPRCCQNEPHASGCEKAECQAYQSCTVEKSTAPTQSLATTSITSQKSSSRKAVSVSPTPSSRLVNQRTRLEYPASTAPASVAGQRENEDSVVVPAENSIWSTKTQAEFTTQRSTNNPWKSLKTRVHNDTRLTEEPVEKYHHILRISLALLFGEIALILLLVIGGVSVVQFRRRRDSKKSATTTESVENGPNGTDDTVSKESSNKSDEVYKMKLSDFADQQPIAFEKVCTALNVKRGRGHYEHVAKHYGIDHDTIKSTFEGYGENPSKNMFELLRAERPDLTVGDIVKVLTKFRRNDVANHFQLSKH